MFNSLFLFELFRVLYGCAVFCAKTIYYNRNSDYEPLSMNIKTADGIVKRTDIWIGDEAKGRLNACHVFQQNGTTVK